MKRVAKGRASGRALPWVIGAVLVLVAGVVTAATPPEQALLDPFVVRGAADGGPATSRTLAAVVVDVTRTEQVTMTDEEWEAEGNWLVVELAVSAPTTEVDAAIGVASLLIDGRVFQASERPPATLVATDLRVGTDTVGMLAFELPDELRSGVGELRLSGRYPTPELDDVIAFRVDLDQASTAPSVEIEAPRLGTP
ncbi:hypothetical protein [Microbacterium sp. TPD7012]|uniref:hypothetical protein n=1 Tax=Microbacterium sp. TPD7012 TaxID=2171975 RepID=UPI000D523BED|nr:hypothetical protein [Microbacterium sp. TPD7012]PVE94674.1 hypothetical protein DC434_11985 [Microbacterium sp. TPD7012]